MNNTSSESSLKTKSRQRGRSIDLDKLIDELKEEIENKDSSSSQKEDDSVKENKEDDDSEYELDTELENDNNQNNRRTDIKNISSQSSIEKQELELLNEIKRQVTESLSHISDELLEDIKKLKDSIGIGGFTTHIKDTPFSPSNADKNEVSKIEKILKTLRGDLSFDIKRFQKSGKLDMHSALKDEREQSLKVFRKIRLSKVDKSKLGVSVLIDSSGSINEQTFSVEIAAVWCLVEALTRLDNKVEVIEFSEDTKKIKGFDTAGDWRRHFSGGTIVNSALIESLHDLLQ